MSSFFLWAQVSHEIQHHPFIETMSTRPGKCGPCHHEVQTRNGSNQYQSMIKCADCGKVLCQLYQQVDRQILAETPTVQLVLQEDRKQRLAKETARTRNLEHQVKELQAELTALKEKLEEDSWQEVVETTSVATQTDPTGSE